MSPCTCDGQKSAAGASIILGRCLRSAACSSASWPVPTPPPPRPACSPPPLPSATPRRGRAWRTTGPTFSTATWPSASASARPTRRSGTSARPPAASVSWAGDYHHFISPYLVAWLSRMWGFPCLLSVNACLQGCGNEQNALCNSPALSCPLIGDADCKRSCGYCPDLG